MRTRTPTDIRRSVQRRLDAFGTWRSTQRRHLLARPLAGTIAGWRGREVVHVVGDSHARGFDHARRARLLPRTVLSVLSVRAASCYGLGNPDSASGASRRFAAELGRIAPGRTVVFCLGEVDLAFLAWSRAERTGVDVLDVLRTSVERYEAFVRAEAGHLEPTIMAAPYPTVVDPTSGRLKARRTVDVAIDRRIETTAWFNRQLEAMAARNGWRWLDTTAAALDPATGRVHDALTRPGDHHYDMAGLAVLVSDELRRLGHR